MHQWTNFPKIKILCVWTFTWSKFNGKDQQVFPWLKVVTSL